MINQCEICNGSRTVRLPRYRRLSAIPIPDDFAVSNPISDDPLTIPCPECSGVANQERVSVLAGKSEYDIRLETQPEFPKYIHDNMAHKLAWELLKSCLLYTSPSPRDS